MDIGVLGPLCEGAGERKRDWGREFKILFSPSLVRGRLWLYAMREVSLLSAAASLAFPPDL